MANEGAIRMVKSAINRMHGDMLRVGNRVDAALAREIYRIYQNAQRARWMSENKSEGRPWKALNPTYQVKKIKRFAAYPGGGRKMLIATGALQASVIGTDTKHHRRLIERNRMVVATTLPYAAYVAEVRPFMEFGKATKAKIRAAIKKYWVGLLKGRKS